MEGCYFFNDSNNQQLGVLFSLLIFPCLSFAIVKYYIFQFQIQLSSVNTPLVSKTTSATTTSYLVEQSNPETNPEHIQCNVDGSNQHGKQAPKENTTALMVHFIKFVRLGCCPVGKFHRGKVMTLGHPVLVKTVKNSY